MGLREAIKEENRWGKTWNGCETPVTTGDNLLDMFGRAGSMRQATVTERELMFSKAFKENPDLAVKLLFYVRDIRGGYGEKDTFKLMFRHLAQINKESVAKNLWAVLEFGCAKDLYSLIGTEAEDDMWAFMKSQFELDLENLEAGKGISLLAKWIATPGSKSPKTKELAKLTAKKLGYKYDRMAEYKAKLRRLRQELDLPEAKVCSGRFSEIEYSKCASRFLFKYRNVLAKKDAERWAEFTKKVDSGEAKMNTGTLTPVDIITQVRDNYTSDLETMWKALEDVCKGNALVMADTSGSMTWGNSSVRPLDVAVALALYFAQRNKGDLKDMFMTFDTRPKFIEMSGATLRDNYRICERADWGGSTNLEAGFDLLLKTCIKGNVSAEEMPDALVIVSDMQINCVRGVGSDTNMTFYDAMKARYEAAGYKMPQVIFWNVNAVNPTFLASKTDRGVSLVSGYSVNIFKQAMEKIDSTPFELMMQILTSERYKDVVA